MCWGPARDQSFIQPGKRPFVMLVSSVVRLSLEHLRKCFDCGAGVRGEVGGKVRREAQKKKISKQSLVNWRQQLLAPNPNAQSFPPLQTGASCTPSPRRGGACRSAAPRAHTRGGPETRGFGMPRTFQAARGACQIFWKWRKRFSRGRGRSPQRRRPWWVGGWVGFWRGGTASSATFSTKATSLPPTFVTIL